jgi:WD40 repeat protein
LRTFQDAERIQYAAISQQGNLLLMLGQYGTGEDDHATLWDVGTGAKLQTFPCDCRIPLATISPDEQTVLLGTDEGAAILYDTKTGNKTRSFQGHEGLVLSAAFSRNGRHLLTGSSDGTTRLWEVATGKQLAQLISLESGKDWLVVTPEGFFDGSAGGSSRVTWRVREGLELIEDKSLTQGRHYSGLLAALLRGESPKPSDGQ